jgi:hypothetical protein
MEHRETKPENEEAGSAEAPKPSTASSSAAEKAEFILPPRFPVGGIITPQ